MTTMADNRPYPVRFKGPLRASVEATVAKTGLSFPETIRQAITFGLPVVEARLKKTGRKK